MKRSALKACTAWVAAASLLAPSFAMAQTASVTAQPQTAASGFGTVSQYFRDPAQDAPMPQAQLINLLRHRVKYVFVLCRWTIGLDSFASAGLALLLAVAAGALSFWLIEQPTRQNARMARLPRGLVVAGALLAVVGAWRGGTKLLYAKSRISTPFTLGSENPPVR